MRFHSHHNRREEKGVALLLALFALILISAVGVAIVFMSTSETSIVANERAASGAWEGAKGGLEEMRGRLSLSDPNTISSTIPASDFRPTDTLHVVYIFNPAPGDPAFTANNPPPAPYTDTEYKTEWGVDITALPAGNIKTFTSDMQGLLPPGGPLPAIPSYKWVRLTVKTELSSQQDVDGILPLDAVIPISYDGTQLRQVLIPAPPVNTIVFRLTALSVLPNGATRMLQYDVRAGWPIPSFPGAITACGPSVSAPGWPSSKNWVIQGNDTAAPPGPPVLGVATCSPPSPDITPLPATVKNPPLGARCPPTCPSVQNASATMAFCLKDYTCLTNLAASLSANATSINPGSVPGTTPSGCPGGTAAAPVITLYTPTIPATVPPMSCTGGGSGYGIMIATTDVIFGGNFTYNGIILVVGTGKFSYAGTNTFNGAVYVANTSSGAPPLGVPTILGAGGGVGAINYNSALINQMKNLSLYQVLAAREISQ